MSTTTDVCLYHLKVLLLDISPMLWRRLLVRSDSTIADLHHSLHIAIGWNRYPPPPVPHPREKVWSITD